MLEEHRQVIVEVQEIAEELNLGVNCTHVVRGGSKRLASVSFRAPSVLVGLPQIASRRGRTHPSPPATVRPRPSPVF